MQTDDAEAEAAGPTLNYGEGVPEQGMMWVNTENLAVKFEAPSAWTIDEIQWKGFEIAGPTGHFGTVLVPKGGDWIGTGHSEGGREVVHSLRLTADGQQQPVETGATLSGDRFELFKKSTIHKFDAEHTVTVRGSEIIQRARLTATEAHELSLMYLFMHCIEPATTRWAAELPDGSFEEGVLDSDGESDQRFELQKPARWVAQHFPDRDLSVLLYLTRIPTENGASIKIWDLPRYHKFYVQHNRGISLEDGATLDYTLVLTIVEGEAGDWTATKAAAETLKAHYPPVDAHEE